jgi:alkylglycerol monooxygenase
MNFILYAIPFFFLLIAIELVLEKIKDTDYYRVNDAINSLSAGVLSRMMEIMKAFIPLTVYVMVYENFAQFELPDTPLVWVSAFVLYDFCYYWNHRLGHEMSVLWAAHVVHHSSEEYNLTTALRQSSSSVISWIFYLPMALLGFDPLLLVSVGALNLIYQFWVHTRHVPKLGWYEWIFVTPSNHRVHHAQNQIYIDRNYGGVFILWDRLFGSFQEELDSEPPIYGIRKALHSWNPLWANVQVYNQLIKDSWRTKHWKDKFLVWFGRTGWRPADMERDYPLGRVDLTKFQKFDLPLSAITKFYCVLQHSLTTLIALMFLLNVNSLSVAQQLMLVAAVVYANFSVGAVMERRTIGVWLEWLKNAGILLAVFILPLAQWLAVSLVLSALIGVVLLWFVSKELTANDTQHNTAAAI